MANNTSFLLAAITCQTYVKLTREKKKFVWLGQQSLILTSIYFVLVMMGSQGFSYFVRISIMFNFFLLPEFLLLKSTNGGTA